jgi:hypothetical protein
MKKIFTSPIQATKQKPAENDTEKKTPMYVPLEGKTAAGNAEHRKQNTLPIPSQTQP